MASAPPKASNDPTNFGRSLVGVVDRIAELRGAGVVFIDAGNLHRFRNVGPGEATVIFERVSRPHGTSFLPRPPDTVASRTTVARSQRNTSTSPATEWMNLGLNCGGAALAWIGVVGMSSLAPVTGGVSGIGAVAIYGGAVAASGQCVVSVARTANVYRGREDINQQWDSSKVYTWTMRGADVVGLLGAGGALRELKFTNAALREGGFSFRGALDGATISRPMRRRLTTLLELQGASRIPAAEINRVVRQRLSGWSWRCDRPVCK